MNNIPQLHTAQILKQYGLWATKGLGQNFLEDPGILRNIAGAADIHAEDTVLEVGPGMGSLTRYLSVQARQVVAVELDAQLMPVLRSVLKQYDNVRLVEGDILSLSPAALQLPNDYLVVANIPYNITSAVLRHMLSSEHKPRRMVLTLQKEVAERICAKPPDMSLLALSVQVFGAPIIVDRIPWTAFFPTPKVDSAVMRIDVYAEPAIKSDLLPTFFDLIAAFSQKRKMLRNSLTAGLHMSPKDASAMLLQANIQPERRAETLSLPEWEALAGRIRGA